jgi:hypothetical protein
MVPGGSVVAYWDATGGLGAVGRPASPVVSALLSSGPSWGGAGSCDWPCCPSIKLLSQSPVSRRRVCQGSRRQTMGHRIVIGRVYGHRSFRLRVRESPLTTVDAQPGSAPFSRRRGHDYPSAVRATVAAPGDAIGRTPWRCYPGAPSARMSMNLIVPGSSVLLRPGSGRRAAGDARPDADDELSPETRSRRSVARGSLDPSDPVSLDLSHRRVYVRSEGIEGG